MSTTRLPGLRPAAGIFTALMIASACDDEGALSDELAAPANAEEDAVAQGRPAIDPALALRGLDDEFAGAADAFDVPLELLQAIGWRSA